MGLLVKSFTKINKPSKISYRYIQIKQHIIALFFLSLFLLGTISPTASAVANDYLDSHKPKSENTHKAPDPGATTKEHSLKHPSGMTPTESFVSAAADTSAVDVVGKIKQGNKLAGEALKGISAKPKVTPRELVDKRSASKSISVNADGTLTQKQYLTPHFYKKDSKWATINSKSLTKSPR